MRRSLALLLLLAACSGGSSGAVVDGSGSTLVLYLHGAGANGDVHDRADKLRGVVGPDTRLVGLDAGGDSWGDPKALTAYANALADARARYHPKRVVLLSESMGSLTALQLLTSGRAGRVAEWVAISPVVSLDAALHVPALAGSIQAHWSKDTPPMPTDLTRLRGITVRLLVGTADPLAPTSTQAGPFAARLRPITTVTVTTCGTGHLPSGCYYAGARSVASAWAM